MTNAKQDELVSILANPDTVLFVGSGISMWSGLPSWQSLLNSLIDLCKKRSFKVRIAEEAMERFQFLEAANYINTQITNHDIANFMRNDLGFAAAKPKEIHSLITNLGPDKFVTTNYDNLIEQQLALEGRGQFRAVTNKQVSELADIIKADAKEFIFKPHGDLNDSSTLVITEAQYSRIIADSANHIRYVLETLLSTRPVVFLGYSLQDPDTKMILRFLQEKFVDPAFEYWAILPNLEDDQKEYLHKEYKIKTVGYNHSGDHASLLTLLRDLTRKREEIGSIKNTQDALLQYATRLIQPKEKTEIELPVYNYRSSGLDRYKSLSDLLENCIGDCIILGPAGSGKSFSFENFLIRRGKLLLNKCLGVSHETVNVPILLDGRLYSGSFEKLAQSIMPIGLNLKQLSKSNELLIILDSIDEIPQEYLDTGHWQQDFRDFLNGLEKKKIIFGTRRDQLLKERSLPVYQIGSLEEKDIFIHLAEIGATKQDLSTDLYNGLRRPFTLCLAKKLLPRKRDITNLIELYSTFLSESLSTFGSVQDIQKMINALADLAFFVIQSGRETITIERVLESLSYLDKPRVALDDLVRCGVLNSQINRQVRFLHRSITEYLAAFKLVLLFKEDFTAFDGYLTFRKWDNVIGFATRFLDTSDQYKLLSHICEKDLSLVARIIGDGEFSSENILEAFLTAFLNKSPTWEQIYSIIYPLDEVQFPKSMEQKLIMLEKRGNSVGGWAAAKLMEIESHYFSTFLEKLLTEADFNYCTKLGPNIGERINDQTFQNFLTEILKHSDTYFVRKGEESSSAPHALQSVISELSVDLQEQLIKWAADQPVIVRRVLCDAIGKLKLKSANEFIKAQLALGISEAVFPCVLRYGYRNGHIEAPEFSVELLRTLSVMGEADDERIRWVYDLISILCEQRDDWNTGLLTHKLDNELFKKISNLLIRNPSTNDIESYAKQALLSISTWDPIDFVILHIIAKYDVVLNENDCLDAFKREPSKFIKYFQNFLRTEQMTKYKGRIEFKNAHQWLEILQSSNFDEKIADYQYAGYLVRTFIAKNADAEAEKIIIQQANDPDYCYRDILLTFVLPEIQSITSDVISEASKIKFLELVSKKGMNHFNKFGEFCTEEFITRYAIPYMSALTEPAEISNLSKFFEAIGRSHDRRYFIEPKPSN